MPSYNETFYRHQMDGSLSSARVVVPLLMDLVSPKSVIDVGCGVGTWLNVYSQLGVDEILGIDGDYVDREMLLIDKANFRAADLSMPLDIGRNFDLVQSLEVAEHLAPAHADAFVGGLVALGDVILFSAAVPFQLGTGHVNEQFIDYWIERFAVHSYVPVDCIRPEIWANEAVEVCYRQNAVIFVREAVVDAYPKLTSARARTRVENMSVIHPGLYKPRIDRLLGHLLDAAREFHKNGNFRAAEPLYQQILNFNSRASHVWDLLGQLAAQSGNLNAGLQYIGRALELEPDAAGYAFNLGQVHLAREDRTNAERYFIRALELDPGHLLARQALDTLRS